MNVADAIDEFCVYFHINPLKNEIFYVGIGNVKRPYVKSNRRKFWKNIVNKYGYIVDVVHINLSWKEACILEKFYVKKIGRRDLGLGTLVNLTDGGDGLSNPSKETRLKMSKAALIRGISIEQRIKFSNSKKGKKQSPETVAKRILATTGRKRTKEQKQNISNSLKGKIRSEESRKNIGLGKLGKKLSEETKKKMSSIRIERNIKPSLNNRLAVLKATQKSVFQYTVEGVFIKEWDSISNAAKALNISSSGISMCCQGNSKTSGKFKWKYKNNINNMNTKPSEVENLLNELRNMKSESSKIQNSPEVWAKIGANDWQGAGFSSVAEMQQFILDHPYSNIA